MTAKALISTGWRVRLGGMAAMFVGFCAFFLYDGFVGYPRQRDIHDQFTAYIAATYDIKILQGLEPTNHDAFMEIAVTQTGKGKMALYESWDEHAAKNGLPPSGKDGKDIRAMEKNDSSILWQKIFGFGLIPLAVMMVYAWVQTFSRWVAADENGVTTSGGQSAPWASMIKLDKLRWPKKGIAFLYYDDADKRINQRILLDDFKFDRVATEQIVRAIEEHLKDDQIVGDIRETERDKRKAAAVKEEPAEGK